MDMDWRRFVASPGMGRRSRRRQKEGNMMDGGL
jgi:hypothetical protein